MDNDMRELKHFEGETVLERFKSMEKDGVNAENIEDFFGAENSMYLALNMVGRVDLDQYKEFSRYFNVRYCQSKLFLDVFDDVWGQKPLILRLF